LTLEPARIPGTVPSLVMRGGNQGNIRQVLGKSHLGKQSVGMLRVLLDVLVFFGGQLCGLQQDIVPHSDFSIVVQQPRVINSPYVCFAEAHISSDTCCDYSYSRGVTYGRVIARIE